MFLAISMQWGPPTPPARVMTVDCRAVGLISVRTLTAGTRDQLCEVIHEKGTLGHWLVYGN